MNEVFAPVAGHPGYEVSNHGNVRSYLSTAHTGLLLTSVSHPLRPRPGSNGYLRVQLRGRETFVHRLVLIAFAGPPPPDRPEASHLNGDKTDNRAENLIWESHAENQQRKRQHGTDKRGSKSHLATLTEAQATEIKRRAKARTQLQREIAADFGVGQSVVSNILSGKTWSHLA